MEKRVAIVTGASQGLGRAVAIQLAKNGLDVWLVARNVRRLKSVEREIETQGGNSRAYSCDIRKARSIQTFARALELHDSKVDVLVNCAGIWIEGPLESTPIKDIESALTTNTLGTILMTQAVLGQMKSRGTGHIVNIISTSGLEPDGRWPIYTASKFALRGFTDSLRIYLEGSGIRVTGIYPAGISTKFFLNANVSLSDHEPWMMRPESVATIIVQAIEAPDDVGLTSLELRRHGVPVRTGGTEV